MTSSKTNPSLSSPIHLARKQIVVPHAEQWTMTSQVEQRQYQIMLYTPTEPPPPLGYPVIYVLDGNSVFASMVDAVRVQGRRPDKTGVIPAVIVGIGYDVPDPFSPDRYYDYTPLATTAYQQRPDGTPIPEQGGADAFLQFIEQELKPEIQQECAIDRNRQSIFGHSLGGLLVLHALFSRPAAFQYYLAGSPSIHWNHEYMLRQEEQFITMLTHYPVPFKLLIGMGELEKSHVARNNDKSQQLIDRLSILSSAHPQIEVKYKEFADENHVSVLPILISQMMRFALHP